MLTSAIMRLFKWAMMFVGFVAGIIFAVIVSFVFSGLGISHFFANHLTSLSFIAAVAGAYLVHRAFKAYEDRSPMNLQGGSTRDVHTPFDDFDYEDLRVSPRSRSGSYQSSRSAAPVIKPEGEHFSYSRHVYGRIGGTMDQADFGDDNIDAGLAGEKKLSRLVERVMDECATKTSAVDAKKSSSKNMAYLFRGLIWPGSKNADIDFIVALPGRTVHKAHIIMIDAKMWKRGAYRWDGQMAYRDGKPYHEIRFENAIEGVRDHFPGCSVEAYVVIFGATTAINDNSYGMQIMTPDDFEAMLKDAIVLRSRGSKVPFDVGMRLGKMVKVADTKVAKAAAEVL